ncbi:hypothetical protein I6H07_05750 [Hafnia alvei]|uniref:hypothetical protein n=1 Tax=Hafnia alvei TaxID=569 RepID=UPI000B6D0906|nr:hypothetical protein [Hafnia alvei]MBI0275339.1 hypothetical protein [Hafnia alvei]PNK98659.1 hypothetical protein CEQ28_014240 [Hafnia alvei]
MDAGWIATLITWIVIFPLMLFIGKTWLQSTVQNAVKHEYDVMLETIKTANATILEKQKRQHELRMKSALIAELMAEWVSIPGDRKQLRKLTNEAFLWLPADLATELSERLSLGAGDPGYHEFMNKIRKYLQGQDDTLESYRFITFPSSPYELRKRKEEAEIS